jgi:hypothetical protein
MLPRMTADVWALGERVVHVVKQFAAGRSQHDDIALVGFGGLGWGHLLSPSQAVQLVYVSQLTELRTARVEVVG